MTGETSWFEDPALLVSEIRSSAPAPADVPHIAGYTHLLEIARGGQGVVFRARQESTRRIVALKVLLDGAGASPAGRTRFQREIDLAASLRHPNIVRVYDCGETANGRLYCVMEFVKGRRLDEYAASVRQAEDAPRAVRRLLSLFRDIAAAVNHAHQHGVIHRDLKPGNVRIDEQGRPQLLDFGLAKEVDAARQQASLSVTESGQFLGTVLYASPEQALAESADVDIRSDVYSLGVLLYECLSGRLPYERGAGVHSTLRRIAEDDPIPISGLNPCVDDEVATIVHRCLAKEPQRRYQSAGELAEDIDRYLTGLPIRAKGDSAWYAMRKRLRRYRLAAAVSTVVLLAAVLTTAISISFWRQTVDERDAAQLANAQFETINGFLQDMLASVDPAVARGEEITVREMLDAAARDIGMRFAENPRLEAPLRETIGRTYAALGMYAESVSHLRRAFELRRSRAGLAETETLWSLRELAHALIQAERLDEADALIEQANDQTDLRAADPAALLGLDGARALLLHWRGELDAARTLYEGTLQQQESLLGPEHPETAATRSDFAVLLLDMGEYEAAHEQAARIVEARAKELGDDHPHTLAARADLATILQNLGRLPEAQNLLEAVLGDMRHVLGDEHPLTLNHILNLGSVLDERDRRDEAEALLRGAHAALVRLRGPTADDALRALNNLALVLIETDRAAEAEPLLRDTLQALIAMYGETDHRTLQVMHNLAAVLEKSGDRAGAADLLARVAEARRSALGAAHPQTLSTLNNRGHLLVDLGRDVEAERIFREIIDSGGSALPADHYVLGIFRGGLGRALLAQRRFPDAEGELLAAYDIHRRSLGLETEAARRVASYLAELYDAWGRPEEARRYRHDASEKESD